MEPDGTESSPRRMLVGESSPYASPRRLPTREEGRNGQTQYSTLNLGFQTSGAGNNYSSNIGGPRPPLPCRLTRPPPPLRCSSLDRAHYSAPLNNCPITQKLEPEAAKISAVAKMASETFPSPEDPRTPTNPPLPPLPTDSGSCGSSSSSGYSSQAGGPPPPPPPQEDDTPHCSMELLPMHPTSIPMAISMPNSLISSPPEQLPPPPPPFDPLYGNLN